MNDAERQAIAAAAAGRAQLAAGQFSVELGWSLDSLAMLDGVCEPR